jgi:DNA-directed RNA polymerase subunit M/transcription elongation factor TFIIS
MGIEIMGQNRWVSKIRSKEEMSDILFPCKKCGKEFTSLDP